MSARGSLLIALSAAVAACALLAGCAASPAPTAPPRTPSPAPAPTVEAEPEAGVLRFTASAVTIETADGEYSAAGELRDRWLSRQGRSILARPRGNGLATGP